jgi:hypothetical protein
MMSKVGSRTKFNLEYMPWVEEDEIESSDPLEIDRLTDTRDIIKEDADRFRRLCKENGFNFTKLNKEYERKLKAVGKLKERLRDLERQLARARWRETAKKARLREDIKKVEIEIEDLMQ